VIGADRLEQVDELDEIRSDWSRLALAAGTPFATPEWAQAWIAHIGRPDEVRIFAIRDDAGRVIVILPLTLRRRRRPSVVRFIGHGPGDELGPVCAPADRRVAAEGLRQALRIMHADVLLAEQLPGGASWDRLLDAQPVMDTGYPVLGLDGIGDADSLHARFGPSIARKLGRVRRKLERAGELRIRVAAPGQGLAADIDALFALHRARWAPEVTEFAGPHEAFHRDFLQVAAARGWLALLLVEIDGRTVAAVYDLRFAGRQHQYQQGRDPACDRLSVGFLALLSAMTGAACDGMTEYRFLRGDEAYKYDYADADPRLQTFVVGRGAAGQVAARSATGLRRHARPLVRRWLAA
jgi:CelD/BcsL family acetyltransferase involved in cellulose biosynthesis